MSVKTSPRRIARQQAARIGQWYTSTIDGTTQGRVTAIEGRMVRVELHGGRVTDDCFGGEFADSWS